MYFITSASFQFTYFRSYIVFVKHRMMTRNSMLDVMDVRDGSTHDVLGSLKSTYLLIPLNLRTFKKRRRG